MRGEASRIADRVSRDSMASKLKDAGEDTWRIGNELFTMTALLDGNHAITAALSDPSRPVSDKVTLLNTLVGTQTHLLTMSILTDLVNRVWSRSTDIANAVEDFGVDAMMYYADYTNTTLQVSIELAQLHSALLNMPVVRARLYDEQATADARVKLLETLLAESGFSKVTMRLAKHATANLRRRRYLSTIQWLISKFSRHMGESMITVTTASPLTTEQIRKLSTTYSAKLGRPVHINSVVDASVIGGMRIQVADQVTDMTVVAQLRQLRGSISASA
ncbi:F0F1 ATP synthase subunit delta [Bifidobacterium mongoliense]|uniref:F0F1 ATP synthase subunit delta n=1 Tax=Bifidobacterium mongoliense TaxID=518643 RepID=UPI0026484AB9|nr:F0F1 ATP synthase subunit delta [Bifidobacterium mongoliense]MDN6025712.1 F0F1 ATP synthase subunit delta [Bifidobacterium mongoliense]MDN6051694.1 F0F1 ATP synthase subunit delta [Bifidobacterium mongoliense]MDN6719900.1 F0F1 ATP synthase subunit delta [Bifidobacterium mongoliense]